MGQEANPGKTNREIIEHLPYVGESSKVLTRQAALAAFFVLRQRNPHLHSQLQAQLAATQQSIIEQLAEHRASEGHYEIGEAVLRGIVAQSIMLGSIQTALSVGTTLEEISQLEQFERGDSPEDQSETGA